MWYSGWSYFSKLLGAEMLRKAFFVFLIALNVANVIESGMNLPFWSIPYLYVALLSGLTNVLLARALVRK